MTQKAITKLNGNTIGFVIILFVVTSVGSLSTEDSLSNEEGFLTTIGDDLSIAEETEGYTVTSVASPYARVSEEIKDSVVTASRPRKVDSLPAFVAKPSILQAFSSRLGEPEQIPDTDTQERSGGFRRGKGCQQYLLQVRKELHCTATPHFEQFGSFDARLRAQDASTQAQHERLESIEKTMRNFQTSIDALGQRFSHLNVQRDDETYDAGFDTASREASTILISMTQQLQQRLLVMGRKIEESERQRSVLVESSKNLSALLQQSQKLVETLTEEKNQHEANSSKLQVELTQSKHNISMLTNVKNKMLKKIVSLRNCQICKNTNRRCFKQCKNEMKKQMSARRQCQLRLQNITVTLSLLTSELTRLKEIKSSQEKTSSTDDETIEVRPPCVDDSSNSTNTSINRLQNLECGKLVSIGNPILISEMELPGKKCGVWMRDAKPTEENREKIWSLSIPGRQACGSTYNQRRTISAKRRKEPTLSLFQYANENEFCLHRPELEIHLPKHKQMESTGAIIYNGSLYYQRRNSRRIVKFHIQSRKLLAEFAIKTAGFHGMFAYQWGGYSDIDLAADELGLWAVYSSTAQEGNIIVAQIDSDSLKPIRVVHTTMKKSDVANSFIICGILYTVSSYSRSNSTINYAFNLLTETPLQINLHFRNAYRYNTMIDYNPVDQQIYSWDNGRRVVYPIALGQFSQDADIFDNFTSKVENTTSQ